ncbi:MAG: hypothetical protein ACQEWG_14895 [Bacteroidota bacterium]
MGQLKFERKFREKLNERVIDPKPGSWEEISMRLDSEEKKRNPIFWWVGIAATIIGGILIFGSFFNEPLGNTPGIVNVPVEKPEQEENRIQQETSEKAKPEAIAFEEKKEITETPTRENTLKVSKKKEPSIRQDKGNIVAVNERLRVMEPILEPEIIVTEVPELSQSIQNAMAEVVLQEGGRNISDAEVDALLAEASSKLNKSREQKEFSEKITANALLWDVDMELEASFREKVFDVVKDGFIKARIAMENRNN